MGAVYLGTGGTRVVHLDHTTACGGAELALVRLLRAGGDWLPAVLVPTAEAGDAFAALPPTVPCRTAGVSQRSGGSTHAPLRLAALGARLIVQAVMTRLDPLVRTCDVVAANSTRAAAYAALALVASRTPLVVHLRDLVDAESLGRFGYRVMSRLVLPRADGVIANSRATLATARPFVRDETITAVIPSAAGLQRAPARPARTGPLRIGMLARIDPWKGQEELLEAFAMARGDSTAELELAGGAPFEHGDFATRLTARAAELGVAEHVRLLGHVDDVPAALARWDIAVQYSTRAEPLGQNVLQYLAAGLATIVADEGGPREWVTDGENGRRVEPRNPQALALVLRELIDDASARERLAAAAAETPGLLDDAAVARAHAEIYRKIAVGRRAPAKA